MMTMCEGSSRERLLTVKVVVAVPGKRRSAGSLQWWSQHEEPSSAAGMLRQLCLRAKSIVQRNVSHTLHTSKTLRWTTSLSSSSQEEV
jgi:hypothetical protein